MKRLLAIVMVCSAIIAATVAVFVMYVAWVDAPPGEFREVGTDGRLLIHWGPWLVLGVVWFSFVLIPSLLAGGGVAAFLWWCRRRRAAR